MKRPFIGTRELLGNANKKPFNKGYRLRDKLTWF